MINMWRNILADIKMCLRDKSVILWLVLFPIVLSTIFFLAFDGLSESATIDSKIEIGVIGYQENGTFEQVLSQISDSDGVVGEKDMFTVEKFSSKEEAEKALDKGDITSAVLIDNADLTFISLSSGSEQTVCNTFLNMFMSQKATIDNAIKAASSPAEIQTIVGEVSETFASEIEVLKQKEISSNGMDQMTNYYYALLGMVAMYFSMAGVEIIKNSQPSQSLIATRQSVAPIKRSRILIENLIAMFILGVAIMLLALFYMAVVLGIDFGNILLVILACIVGMTTGLTFGMFLAALFRGKYQTKTMIAMMVVMALSFFAGLMGSFMKSIIVENAPILNYINPVALISDCFLSLYFFESLTQFGIRIGLLCAYIGVLTIATVLLVRRKKYANI